MKQKRDIKYTHAVPVEKLQKRKTCSLKADYELYK